MDSLFLLLVRFTKLVVGIIHEAEGAGEIQKVKFPEIKWTVQNLVYDKGVTVIDSVLVILIVFKYY